MVAKRRISDLAEHEGDDIVRSVIYQAIEEIEEPLWACSLEYSSAVTSAQRDPRNIPFVQIRNIAGVMVEDGTVRARHEHALCAAGSYSQ